MRLDHLRLDHLQRREFIALIGGAAATCTPATCTAATWPFALRAQQRPRLPTIGFLGSGTSAADTPWTTPYA